MYSWSALLHYSGVIVFFWLASTCLALAARKQLYLIISSSYCCYYHLPTQDLPRLSQIPWQFCSRKKEITEGYFILIFAPLLETTTVMFVFLQHFLLADFPTKLHWCNVSQNWVSNSVFCILQDSVL